MSKHTLKRIACRICGKRLVCITQTHLDRHGVTTAEYSTRYGPMWSDDLRLRRQKSVQARFESRFERQANGCWLWTAGKTATDGYGKMSVRGKIVLAHRVAYELYVGPVSGDVEVLHSCDNRACVNPDHLWPGDQADNMRDAGEKGRIKHSQGHHWAKLTDDIVRRLRSRTHTSAELTMLAATLRVSIVTLRRALRGTTWRHVPCL
jgi:hypothetical protein